MIEIRHIGTGKVLHVVDAKTLRWADLSEADLRGANLRGANLPTGERWDEYLREVVPALLTAGGKELGAVAVAEHWDCHLWDNCPMAAAFGADGLDGVPVLHRPRAEQFIQFFDAGLIPLESVGGVK